MIKSAHTSVPHYWGPKVRSLEKFASQGRQSQGGNGSAGAPPPSAAGEGADGDQDAVEVPAGRHKEGV